MSNYDQEYGKRPESVGPWGGQGGFTWDDGVHSAVRKVMICHGAGIDSIRIQYDDRGTPVLLDKHGGSGGHKSDTVELDYPNEFLTSVHGHYCNLAEGETVYIRSLTLQSNKRTYGPFGIELGTAFSLPGCGGRIVGFHGKSSRYLDAIGVYINPTQRKLNQPQAVVRTQSYLTSRTSKTEYSVIQDSVGKSYDIVVAIRQKDDYDNNPHIRSSFPMKSLFRKASSIDEEPQKQKMLGSPQSVERNVSIIDGPVTYGPWGGNGGTVFDDGHYAGVRQIVLSRNVGVVSIRVLYDKDGEASWGMKNGCTGGFKKDKICFDYPYEILTYITGFYGPTMLMGTNIIRSLTFHTTNAKYGPYGEEQGKPFSSNIREGNIVGFHGRSGLFIDAIGVHVIEGKVTPLPRPPPSPSNPTTTAPAPIKNAEEDNPHWYGKLMPAKRSPVEEAVAKIVKEPAPCGTGPWGGEGGRPWDDGVFTGIKQIFITRGREAICSIQIEYDRNRQSVWSVIHGGNDGTNATFRNQITLQHPNEVLTCISGYYGPIPGNEQLTVIRSLTFYTSRGKYGPFGEETGKFFTSTTTEGKVVGFHGRSGMYLDAIGVHMQHWLGSQRSTKPLLKIFN